MEITRLLNRTAMAFGFLPLLQLGCATALVEVPLSDGNILVVAGYGTKAMAAQKCLSADAIKSLTNSDIPADVPQRPCYWVQLISADSTDISKAVSSFIAANDEFADKVTNLAAPNSVENGVEKPPDGKRSAAIEQADQVLAAAALGEDISKLIAGAKNLPDEEKSAIKAELTKLRAGVINPDLQKRLDAVLAAI